MSLDVLDLRLLCHVVEHGSITSGADASHLSLAAASTRITAMERTVGFPLLERHRRGVRPTPRGEQVLAHARELIGRYDRMRLELADLAGNRPATVTLLVNTAAATLLPDAVVGFLADHPEADVDLVERPSHRIVAALVEGRAELGVVADTVECGRLETVVLAHDPLVVVVPPGHRLADAGALAFGDVVDEPLVGFAEQSPLEEHLLAHAEPFGNQPRRRARLPDTDSVRRAVAAGVGVAILPARSAGPDLVGVRLLDDWADRDLLLAVRSRSELSGPARELATHLVNRHAPSATGR